MKEQVLDVTPKKMYVFRLVVPLLLLFVQCCYIPAEWAAGVDVNTFLHGELVP